jgi:hypothetical protein
MYKILPFKAQKNADINIVDKLKIIFIYQKHVIIIYNLKKKKNIKILIFFYF